uniref:Secreted protein n=1 Tax=Naja naja TaxID=35670 RepID=A0A8C6X945_NAJNA
MGALSLASMTLIHILAVPVFVGLPPSTEVKSSRIELKMDANIISACSSLSRNFSSISSVCLKPFFPICVSREKWLLPLS